jgi:3-carboxymuconate cyclase
MGGKTVVYAANTGTSDISMMELEPSGQLRSLGVMPASGPASTIAVGPDKRFLHVSIRSEQPGVETFAIDPSNGGLRSVSRMPAPDIMTYLSMDATGGFLLGASYRGNLAVVWKAGPDGLPVARPLAVLEAGIRLHAVLADPSNRFVFVPALGGDVVLQYAFDARTGALRPNTPPSVRTPEGSGPRHFRFSPDGRFVYLLTELSGDLITYAFDAASGLLEERSTISIIPPVAPEQKALRMWAAEIQVRPDGRFVYASERTSGNIVCFKADVETGALRYAHHITAEEQPRGFAIDPTGGYLVAAGELSGHVSCYAIDGETGALRDISRVPVGQGTNWVTILPL